MQRLPRLVTPLLFVAFCALVVWWVMRLLPGSTIASPPTAAADGAAGAGRAEAVLASARLFGSRRPGVLSDNVRVLGVVADATGRGSAIASIDGQAAKVFHVGDTLDGRVVSAIRSEEIELETGGARQVFRMAARPAATGVTLSGIAAVVPPPPSVAPPIRMQPAPPPTSQVVPSPPSGPASGPEQ